MQKTANKTAYVLAEDAAKAYISVSDNLWMEAQNAAQIEYKGNHNRKIYYQHLP